MSRFIEEAIARAGLLTVLQAWRSGDLAAVRATVASWSAADLLPLGAVADAIRSEDAGEKVFIHEGATGRRAAEDLVVWVETPAPASELDALRAVAVARIAAPKGARIGFDWSQRGLELAQVALGFGASDLRGPITRKSGLPILEGETRKRKGLGMVELAAIRRAQIAALVTHARRVPIFVEDVATGAREASQEAAGV